MPVVGPNGSKTFDEGDGVDVFGGETTAAAAVTEGANGSNGDVDDGTDVDCDVNAGCGDGTEPNGWLPTTAIEGDGKG